MKVCAFTGSRPERFPWGDDETDERCKRLKREIYSTVKSLIADGYSRFISGMARGADTYCAETVLQLKEEFPDVTLECALPCPEQAKGWSESARSRRQRIIDAADKITTLLPHYTQFCMNKRNTYMVENADILVAVWDGAQHGGTYNTVRIARRLDVPVKIIGYGR